MLSRYKYRFYPNTDQALRLAQTFGCCRLVYNHILAEVKANKITKLSSNDLKKQVPYLKTVFPFLKDVSSVALQQSLDKLGISFKNFFDSRKGKRKGNKMGFPQFKKRSNQQSATFQSNGYQLQSDGSINVTKVGTIKPIYSRALPSVPTSITIIKDCSNRYFVSFVVQTEPVQIPSQSPSIGIDLGIKTFAACSDGSTYSSPSVYKRLYAKIAKLQRKYDKRQQKGSNRRTKTRLSIAKLHARIADIRKDFLHKVSTLVCSKNQTVSLENLNVSGMLKNRKLSKAISRQGWGEFGTLVQSKCMKYGRNFVEIGRWEPTSQICNSCGFRWGKLDLSVRTITCLNCGCTHDRDENAAKNINNIGMGHRHDVKCTQRACKTEDIRVYAKDTAVFVEA